MLFEVLFLCSLCVGIIYLFTKRSGIDPPALKGKLPIIGHAHKFLGDSIRCCKVITEINDDCMRKGGITTAYVAFKKAYVVTDPEASLVIFNTFLEKPYIYNFGKVFLGAGLLTSNVETWKNHRKLLSPAFSQSVTNGYIQIFNKQARSLVYQMDSHLGRPFDYEHLLKNNNLETICLTATGIGGEEYKSLQQEFRSQIPKLMLNLAERFKRLWMYSDLVYSMTSLKKEQDAISEKIMNLSNLILQKKKAEMKNIITETNNKRSRRAKPFLDLILDIVNETQCFTDNEIKDEINIIISAGHETTASTLNLTLIVLGSYPEVQDKVYNEIIQVVGDTDKDFDKYDLSKLVYTEAVLKETLRLYPIVPVIGRLIDKDFTIGNYTLKANTTCIVSIYGVNRHPVWGPDADQFRPERWLDAATLPDKKYFSSFALGRRNCIGKAYAMISMKTTLAHVVRKYRVHSDISNFVSHRPNEREEMGVIALVVEQKQTRSYYKRVRSSLLSQNYPPSIQERPFLRIRPVGLFPAS